MKCAGRKTWGVRRMKMLGLQPEYILGYVEGIDIGQMSNPSSAWKKGMFSK